MSNICEQSFATQAPGLNPEYAIPMVYYKGQIVPMQPGMVIDPCFVGASTGVSTGGIQSISLQPTPEPPVTP